MAITSVLRRDDTVVAEPATDVDAVHLSPLGLLDPTRHLGLDGVHLIGVAYDLIAARALDVLAAC
jgi:hypothetical protein